MGKKYNNSPIIEAVCEFRFTDDSSWDITIPGLIYEDVRVEFPNKTQRIHQEVNISTTQEPSGKIQSQVQKSEIAVFLTRNEKTLINVGPRTFSINQLKPYITWTDFKSRIEYAFNKLIRRVEDASIQRIGLRYINRIEIPGKDMDLKDYFEFRPFLGPKLPQNLNSFIIGCIFPHFDERDTCKVQLTNAVPEKNENSAFILDIDYALAKPKSISADQSLEWVEKAHDSIESTFEGCISQSIRDQLGEEK